MRVSKINLIGQRMEELELSQSKNGFISKLFFRKRFFELDEVFITLDLQHYAVIRGELFCEDIIEIAGGELKDFNIDHLISILYMDFLHDIRKRDIESIYTKLSRLKSKYQMHTEVIDFRKNSLNTWKRIEQTLPKRTKVINYKVHINKRAALRGEILLHELMTKYSDLTITLEEAISFLYMDFIESIKNGISREVVYKLTGE